MTASTPPASPLSPPDTRSATRLGRQATTGFREVAHPDRTRSLHYFLETSRYAFADRNAYLGDPDYVDVPLRCLLSDAFGILTAIAAIGALTFLSGVVAAWVMYETLPARRGAPSGQ